MLFTPTVLAITILSRFLFPLLMIIMLTVTSLLFTRNHPSDQRFSSMLLSLFFQLGASMAIPNFDAFVHDWYDAATEAA